MEDGGENGFREENQQRGTRAGGANDEEEEEERLEEATRKSLSRFVQQIAFAKQNQVET